MKFVFSKVKSAVCPSCGSGKIYRSRRKGFVEFVLGWLFFIRPYRCESCDERFFRLRLSRARNAPDRPLRLSHR